MNRNNHSIGVSNMKSIQIFEISIEKRLKILYKYLKILFHYSKHFIGERDVSIIKYFEVQKYLFCVWMNNIRKKKDQNS
jgi:hypothetical protein